MLIIDGHLDLAYNALQYYNRDLLYSAFTIRVQERGTTDLPGAAEGAVALPEMRQGRIALCFATLFARCTGHPKPHADYSSAAQAHGVARGQLAYYRALEKQGHIHIVNNVEDLDSHMAEWEEWDASEDADTENSPPLGIVVSMEGADPILGPDELQEWWELGLRVLGLTHFGTGRYAGGTGTQLGLTDLGVPLLAEMARLAMLADLTHCSDQAFWQVLEHYNGPVLASHSNSRVLVPNQRQLTDEQMKAIIERDGVIGTCADAWQLEPGWVLGKSTNEHVTLSAMVDHIDHVCQLAGDSRHAAIGSDLDGGYGRDQRPQELETIADLQKLIGILAGRGYSTADIANIMYGNWVRLLRQSWGR